MAHLVLIMPDLDHRDFKLENLPHSVDIHKLAEEEHRTAFLETFSSFLLANELLFKQAEQVEFEAKKPMDWKFEGANSWKSSLTQLAQMSYDSLNDEVIIIVDGKTRILFAMDNPYYAKLAQGTVNIVNAIEPRSCVPAVSRLGVFDAEKKEVNKVSLLFRVLAAFILLCNLIAGAGLAFAFVIEPFEPMLLFGAAAVGMMLYVSACIVFTGYTPNFLLFTHGKKPNP